MCLTKVYYNTYSDGAQDITEKVHPCKDGRNCTRPDVRTYDRKFPFSKLGEAEPESQRSLSERQPTPYFSGHTPRGSKSPSPSGRRDSGVYMSGANTSSKRYDYSDPYGDSYDTYGYSSRRDPRDRYDRPDRNRDREREPRLKRSSTAPHIIYMDRERDRDADRDGKSSRSRSRSGSRDIPLGLVPLADEYGRRRRHSSSSRSRERDGGSDPSHSGLYYTGSSRRRTDDPHGYILHNDDDERRRQRREQKRRLSTSSYIEPSTTSGTTIGDPYAVGGAPYLPRRASTIVHHSDGSISTGAGTGSSGRKQLRWDDQVRAERERHNAEIANRPYPGEVKGILKHTDSMGGKGKGKGREVEDIAGLRRAIERMEIPRSSTGERGRDREPRGRRGEWDWGSSGRYGAEELEDGRRKRSRGYGGDELYRY
ncbi:predicted protein [Chaetomium globosum CBS 148.51]|uniref:Uncharacterized protein n=1 Tax=Chaetomium globosum (strain ATCC 6205 / CBS 148.51 / DSM 1962 / NBRC 6347 / NRRL 1970) TaxID=306901 RepID=Q2H8K8_CHAGB|nr:uncharacterized protein CHGG_03446 [Chaetomium globosum CBS 148.51]EAQ91511.1 predicted protein [Chaetomium globosum CBS 148.51]